MFLPAAIPKRSPCARPSQQDLGRQKASPSLHSSYLTPTQKLHPHPTEQPPLQHGPLHSKLLNECEEQRCWLGIQVLPAGPWTAAWWRHTTSLITPKMLSHRPQPWEGAQPGPKGSFYIGNSMGPVQQLQNSGYAWGSRGMHHHLHASSRVLIVAVSLFPLGLGGTARGGIRNL